MTRQMMLMVAIAIAAGLLWAISMLAMLNQVDRVISAAYTLRMEVETMNERIEDMRTDLKLVGGIQAEESSLASENITLMYLEDQQRGYLEAMEKTLGLKEDR